MEDCEGMSNGWDCKDETVLHPLLDLTMKETPSRHLTSGTRHLPPPRLLPPAPPSSAWALTTKLTSPCCSPIPSAASAVGEELEVKERSRFVGLLPDISQWMMRMRMMMRMMKTTRFGCSPRSRGSWGSTLMVYRGGGSWDENSTKKMDPEEEGEAAVVQKKEYAAVESWRLVSWMRDAVLRRWRFLDELRPYWGDVLGKDGSYGVVFSLVSCAFAFAFCRRCYLLL